MAKGYWYFTPLSVDIGYPFCTDLCTMSGGIGVGRVLLGTSIVEQRRFPGTDDFSDEFFPLDLQVVVFDSNHWRVSGHCRLNTWGVWELYAERSRYYNFGAKGTYRFLRFSAGCFVRHSIPCSHVESPERPVISNVLHATVGAALPNLCGEWNIVPRPERDSLSSSVLACQLASGLVGTVVVGFAGGLATAVGIHAFPCIEPDAFFDNAPMTIGGFFAGGLVGASVGFPTGVWAAGKMTDTDGSYIGSLVGSLGGALLGGAAAFASDGNPICVGLAVGLPIIGSFVGFYNF
jgi:hypothetical protein